jgi:Tol biopolymer transport system component
LIAFQRPNDRTWYAIWTIDDEGYQETEILSSSEEGFINPSWSPDGKQLVMASGGRVEKTKLIKRDSTWGEIIVGRRENDIWLVNSNGLGLTQLTTHREGDWAPKWAANGRIYFVSKRDRYTNVWSIIPETVMFQSDVDIAPTIR